MAEVIIMPKLGFNMDEGELVKWHKQIGDPVKKGEVFFEINTDKTTMPVEATEDGVMLKILLDEGESASVFKPIAVVGKPGEDPEEALAAYLGNNSGTDLKLTPKAKKFVRDEGISTTDLMGIQGTGYQGGITAKDIKASPLARKLANQKAIDLALLQGSGTAGKIMKADVEAAVSMTHGDITTDDTGGKQILTTAPYKGVRKIIGDRLSQSKLTAPHVYFADSIDTTSFTTLRKQLNETGEQKYAVSDLITVAASKALKVFPDLNVSLTNGQIIKYESINIGIAVAGNNGLIVPVIKNIQEKNLTMVAAESRDLIVRAKTGQLAAEEYSGGTFTISNLGMFGIEDFTAIINPPESAILAISSVRKKAIVITNENGGDEIAIRPMMNIRLTVDHRLIDGLLAAQFVAYFKAMLENPLRILL